MSRIGRVPILLPEGVKFLEEDHLVKLSGPLGELIIRVPETLKVIQVDNHINVEPVKDSRQTKGFHGLFRTLIANAVVGVKEGFEKELEVRGVGFKAEKIGDDLVLRLGFSHPIKICAPDQIEFEVQRNIIKVKGIDKQKVGEMAAQLRRLRPPDVYKGKGVRYKGEQIKLKPGKALKTGLGEPGSTQ